MSQRRQLDKSQAGITIIEALLAAFIMIVGSLSMVGLIVRAIATNGRNKMDSTQMMLATSIAEQINSTIIGSGQSTLTDCAGNSHTINTVSDLIVSGGKGANLSGERVDFTENIAADTAKNGYHMDYVLRTPCNSGGTLQGTYDVRWHVDTIGDDIADTNTYLLTIGAKLKNSPAGTVPFASPVSVRLMSGN
jgi:hypothetical protein